MALPQNQIGTFTPSEICFLAEQTPVTIIPRQALAAVDLMAGQIESMRPLRRVDVPLWVAVVLKKQSRCNIVTPDWLSEDNLKVAYEAEVADMTMFSDKLPWEWLEFSELVLNYAADDLSSPAHVIRNLVRDIREVRQAKARAGLKNLNEYYMRLDNIGALELNEIRPFLSLAMNQLRRLNNTRTVPPVQDNHESESESEQDYDETREESSIRTYRPAQTFSDDDGDEDDELEIDQTYVR
ncbi:hypothetical protein V1512DRAFT_244786 [Lipomyces arxii]|uniref:uncharacterized protein n=1 Tax=Lipomyces arxii TaxID=56418 RepID=UPI0034CD61E3